jgi:lipoprotein-anchoring transpeptidase ErfK/SrfK
MEAQNRGARDRCIYIHGTPEERRIGKPASFGCIRMRSRDVIALYNSVHIGMHVSIT